MKKEPVAWMLVDEINGDYMLERHPSGDYDWIPLYTHPAKELTDEEIELIKKFQAERDKLKAEMPKVFADGKRLGIIETEDRFLKAMSMTNEEILSLWDWNSGEILAADLLDFADAILRKAQEK